MMPISVQEVKEALQEILEDIPEIEFVIIQYKFVVSPTGEQDKEIATIIVKYENKPEMVTYKYEYKPGSPIANEIAEFKYKLIDKAEELAEKFLFEYIKEHYPDYQIVDIERILRSNYRKLRIKLKKGDKYVELSIKYLIDKKEVDEEGNLILITEIRTKFSEEDVSIYEY